MSYPRPYLLKSYYQSQVHDLQYLIDLINCKRAVFLINILHLVWVFFFLIEIDPQEEKLEGNKNIVRFLNLFGDE